MNFIIANWRAPARVRTCITTRDGGVSAGPWAGLNLGTHVGDRPEHVAENRQRLRQGAGLPAEPVWLQQVHGRGVVDLDALAEPAGVLEYDGSVTARPGVVSVVQTADCLPLLLCDRAGTKVAALHAGWRGLAGGIIEAGVEAMGLAPEELLVWLGPAIGADAFEVGAEVRQVFVDADPAAAAAFRAGREDRWLADIWQLARLRLQGLGVGQVSGGGLCTFTDAQRFYSYRRDQSTGRMASMIWLDD